MLWTYAWKIQWHAFSQVATVPEEIQFLLPARHREEEKVETLGIYTTQTVESLNEALKPVRGEDTFNALINLVNSEQKRFYTHKREAEDLHRKGAVLTPAGDELFQSLQEKYR